VFNKVTLFLANKRYFVILTALTTGLIFTYRGSGYRRTLWGDDALLVKHALNRQAPFSRLKSIDPFGLLDTFGGYCALQLRLLTKFALVFGLENITTTVFILSVLVWTGCAVYLASIIRSVSRPLTGLLAAIVFSITPFSNLVLMAQITGTYFPVVAVVIIAILSQQLPKSRIGRLAFLLLCAVTALSTPMSLFAFFPSIYFTLKQKAIYKNFELWVAGTLGFGLLVQKYCYVSRDINTTFNRLAHDFVLGANTFAPQYLRARISDPKSPVETITLYGLPVILGAATWLMFKITRNSRHLEIYKIPQRLLYISPLILAVLIYGNGWLNSHYLFIPTEFIWLAILLLCDSVIQTRIPWKFAPILLVAVIFSLGLSGNFFVI